MNRITGEVSEKALRNYVNVGAANDTSGSDINWSVQELTRYGFIEETSDGNYQLTVTGNILCYFLTQFSLVHQASFYLGNAVPMRSNSPTRKVAARRKSRTL